MTLEQIRHYSRYAINALGLVLAILTLPELGAVIPHEWLPVVVAATAAVNTTLSWLRRLVGVLAIVVALAAPAAAQETPQTLHLLQEGFVRAYRNEVSIDGTPADHDPVKLRMGSWFTDSYLAFVGGDLLTGDPMAPRRNERGFFGIRHDDDYPKPVNAHEFVVSLTDPDKGGDEHQRIALRLTTRYLELFGRRVTLEGGVGSPRSYLQAGRWEWHLQESDGNVVKYEVVGGIYCARWAETWLGSYYRGGLGFVDPAALDPPCR